MTFNPQFLNKTNILNKQKMKKIILTSAIILTSGFLVSSSIVSNNHNSNKINPATISKIVKSQNHQEISIAD